MQAYFKYDMFLSLFSTICLTSTEFHLQYLTGSVTKLNCSLDIAVVN